MTMIGMTELVITSTSQMLMKSLDRDYRPNNIITGVESDPCRFSISFPTDIHNEEKESVFETLINKIRNLKDPQDRLMETKIVVVYLQQAIKEYYFSHGELVRYRGFIDTDNPLPMVTNLLIKLDSNK